MADEPNVFTTSWDFSFDGASGAPVGKQAGMELLGATVYELVSGVRPRLGESTSSRKARGSIGRERRCVSESRFGFAAVDDS